MSLVSVLFPVHQLTKVDPQVYHFKYATGGIVNLFEIHLYDSSGMEDVPDVITILLVEAACSFFQPIDVEMFQLLCLPTQCLTQHLSRIWKKTNGFLTTKSIS